MGFFQGTEERVRNSRGRRVISVRATEVLLYASKGDNPLAKLHDLSPRAGEKTVALGMNSIFSEVYQSLKYTRLRAKSGFM